MFHSIVDFCVEYPRVLRGLDARSTCRFLINTILSSPRILREAKLAPLDRAMGESIVVTYHGQKLHFPIDEIEACLAGLHDSPTFGAVREMFLNDVYLWPFQPLTASCVVDLGANRCFFGLIATKVLGAKKYVGVEPLKQYDAVAKIVFDANGISPNQVHIYRMLAGAHDTANSISLPTIIEQLKFDKIDFLKVDIEGGEYEVFDDLSWLNIVNVVAMELHDPIESKGLLAEKLRNVGFSVLCTDTRRRSVLPADAEYLFAARDSASFNNSVRSRVQLAL